MVVGGATAGAAAAVAGAGGVLGVVGVVDAGVFGAVVSVLVGVVPVELSPGVCAALGGVLMRPLVEAVGSGVEGRPELLMF